MYNCVHRNKSARVYDFLKTLLTLIFSVVLNVFRNSKQIAIAKFLRKGAFWRVYSTGCIKKVIEL